MYHGTNGISTPPPPPPKKKKKKKKKKNKGWSIGNEFNITIKVLYCIVQKKGKKFMLSFCIKSEVESISQDGKPLQ